MFGTRIKIMVVAKKSERNSKDSVEQSDNAVIWTTLILEL